MSGFGTPLPVQPIKAGSGFGRLTGLGAGLGADWGAGVDLATLEWYPDLSKVKRLRQ